MDSRILLETLLAEIAEEERALEKKKEFTTFLRERLSAHKTQTLVLSGLASSVKAFATAMESKTNVLVRSSGGPSQPSLRKKVTDLLRDFGEREFVVGDVHGALLQAGVNLPSDPRSKITTILSRMHDSGELVRTSIGGGNVPHKYKVQDLSSAGAEDLSNDEVETEGSDDDEL